MFTYLIENSLNVKSNAGKFSFNNLKFCIMNYTIWMPSVCYSS